jgi:ubiquinone biosynthesis protein
MSLLAVPDLHFRRHRQIAEVLTRHGLRGILAAAFIVGLATLLSVYRPLGWENWAGIMVAVGFFFALALGIYLALSILRSGRD